MRGRAASDSFSRPGRQQALRLYEEALRIDPDFALAHAAIAELYLTRPIGDPPHGRTGGGATRHRSGSESLAFAGAWHNTGLCLQGLGRLDDAIEAYRKLGLPTGNFGHALAVAGRTSEAREMLDGFVRLHQETGRGAGEIAQILIGLGEHEQALDWIERAERDEPGGPSTFKVAAVWDPLRTNPRFVSLLKRWKLDR